MKYSLKICAAVALISASSSASVPTVPNRQYNYLVRVPATSLSCEQEANLLLQRFLGATKITEAQGTCKEVLNVTFNKKSYSLYSLMITYQAQSPMTPYSNTWGTTSQTGIPEGLLGGMYDTFHDCLEALPLKTQQYETYTQLPAVSAFCEVASHGHQFLLQVDGFGTPVNRLFTYHPRYTSTPELRAFIPELITKMGGQAAFTFEANSYYFAPQMLQIGEQSFGIMDSAAHCDAQTEEATNIMQKAGSTIMYTICTGRSGTILQAIADSSSYIRSDFGTYSRNYYSWSECMNDKARVLADEASMGNRPFGAICRPDYSNDELFKIEIYSHL